MPIVGIVFARRTQHAVVRMKTYLIYGAALAIAMALLTMLLYLVGLHSDPAKLNIAQAVGICGMITILAACIVLGTKGRRAEIPATEEFGYGSAFAAGFMIVLFGSLFGIVTTFVYANFINPDFADTIVQAQTQQLEAKGLKPAQIEGAEKMIRKMMSPPMQAVIGFFNTLFFGTIVSLVTAAFLKRSAAAITAEAPPALG
jgi:hypothetical protein